MLNSYFQFLNASYLENLSKQYQRDPHSLDPSWQYFFSGFFLGKEGEASSQGVGFNFEFEFKVIQLIEAYRELGFLLADTNALQRGEKHHPLLKLKRFGLSEADLETVCQSGVILGLGPVSLQKILDELKWAYLSPISVEYSHIHNPSIRLWIQEQFEKKRAQKFSSEVKLQTLQKLIEAQNWESFLHSHFVGQKRFSLEGLDILIPLLDFLIQQASVELGTKEVILGMAHRGRLNVLANIFSKDLVRMLGEFSGHLDANVGDGDVKYHMGFSNNIETKEGKFMHLSLLPNPSHLEAVNSVLMGVTKAKQILNEDEKKQAFLPILIHGEAAFAGQGSVYELFQLSDLSPYSVGGVIHFILNNQVGFTTSAYEGRSTLQASDLATMLEIPIFHVNADEPEAGLRAILLALHFRKEFKKDVIIELMGYRRYGHNESDEPSFTQPLLYQAIDSHPRVQEIYQEKLIGEEIVSLDQVKQREDDYNKRLEEALESAKEKKTSPLMEAFSDQWKSLHAPCAEEIFRPVPTAVRRETLKKIGEGLVHVPGSFHIHPKLKKILAKRQSMIEQEQGLDWSLGEALAFASLLGEGCAVRLAGQDSKRGTFSQRHSIYYDIENGEEYCPFQEIYRHQPHGRFEVVNSPLSEYAAMGFELGQSWANPQQLTLWEAQFGDFVNGAQIILDQFLVSSAVKWNRFSGLVLLLPHGYEGQGPEHSSARLERFLQSCAQNNIQVCYPTTPAQYFHVLRRQVLRDFRLPLVLMTPKSLLRDTRAASDLSEFYEGSFQEILLTAPQGSKESVRRLVLCSGKIYYELEDTLKKMKNQSIALVRVEQFYPFPQESLQKIFASYPTLEEIVWCQEGPKNMEGWTFIHENLRPLLKEGQKLRYAGRGAQASPADSYQHIHEREQNRIISEALGDVL